MSVIETIVVSGVSGLSLGLLIGTVLLTLENKKTLKRLKKEQQQLWVSATGDLHTTTTKKEKA